MLTCLIPFLSEDRYQLIGEMVNCASKELQKGESTNAPVVPLTLTSEALISAQKSDLSLLKCFATAIEDTIKCIKKIIVSS